MYMKFEIIRKLENDVTNDDLIKLHKILAPWKILQSIIERVC